MILEKRNNLKWKQNAIKKLVSFLEKCPVLFSMDVTSRDQKDGVDIIHKGTETTYFFEFNYDQTEKEWIHDIKEYLVPLHYPRLVEPITEAVSLTPEEIAREIEKGKEVSQVSKVALKEIGQRIYRIDKSIIWRSIFILVLEDVQIYGQTKQEPFQQSTYRYKLNINASTYLKKYRSGKFSSIEEASKAFFDSAILINEIDEKKD